MNVRQMTKCFVCSALVGAIVYVSVAGEHRHNHLPHDSQNTSPVRAYNYNSLVSVGTSGTNTTF